MITFSMLGRHGQLGNQLFQYAVLLGVSAKTGSDIAIPMKFDGVKRKNMVELRYFNITAKPLTEAASRHINRVYEELDFTFHESVLSQPDGTDFRGYFQSEKYFKHAEARVRAEFRFNDDITRFTDHDFRNIADKRPVIAVHVRRGDYLNDPHIFQILPPEYYHRAMELDVFKQRDPLYLVFSDDIPWCQEHLRGDNIRYYQSPDHWHDLSALSRCHGHIISGSSFGWWGAWLSQVPDKQVVVPDPLFKHGAPFNCRDVVPDGWIKLEV